MQLQSHPVTVKLICHIWNGGFVVTASKMKLFTSYILVVTANEKPFRKLL